MPDKIALFNYSTGEKQFMNRKNDIFYFVLVFRLGLIYTVNNGVERRTHGETYSPLRADFN